MNNYTYLSVDTASYYGNVSKDLILEACECFRDYSADKEALIDRIKDDEKLYRSWYEKSSRSLKKNFQTSTSFIFSSIENACATSSENFPAANILERSPDGTAVADTLSMIIPVVLDNGGFRKTYKGNIRNKLKYGTSVYSITYNDETGNIDIRSVDLLDIFVDYNISDIQDSKFIFVVSSVDNDLLRFRYPYYEELFSGDTTVETLTSNVKMRNRSSVTDCYYKKPDGSVHMFKACNGKIIDATEDKDGYERGLYNHGMFPFVFDVMYPVEHCPFGFGMIDIAKATQIEIDKLDKGIVSLILMGAKPRYLAKRNSGIDADSFLNVENPIVEYEGDTSAVVPIVIKDVNQYYSVYRDTKKDELKELLGNRDFQQGATSGGVTSGTAISILQQSGEKRARMMFDDSYTCFETIVSMVLELLRQFCEEKRVYRTEDAMGQKSFVAFSREMLYKDGVFDNVALEFDIKVTAQKENPYSAEALNALLMQFFTAGMLTDDNLEKALLIFKNMQFEGKEPFLSDIRGYIDSRKKEAAAQQPETVQGGAIPVQQPGIMPGMNPTAAVPVQAGDM
ncbi:MAG: hypothetical protein ACI4EA_09180 [Candidatus Ornithomonoglobus sp.]